MASTRLTNSIKDALTRRLLEHAFTARSVAQLKAECDLAQEIYDDVMKTREVKLAGGTGDRVSWREATDLLPAAWVSRQDYFQAQMGGTVTKFHRYDGVEPSYGQNKNLVGLKRVPPSERHDWTFPPNAGGHVTIHVYDHAHEFTKRKDLLANSRSDLLEEISSTDRSVRATLDSVTTVQRLIVIWPEVEAFASEFLTEQKAAAVILPVVARERLNDTLGLPPGVAA